MLIYSQNSSKVYLVKLIAELGEISEVMDLIEKFADVLSRRK